ncbi:NAD(P)H-quinone oxidoreductase subunit 4 [Thermocoleostomius sinensis]|uniref:NAD(P)H-quinone oxidoreductase chain 4 n=1 Tax=Thermocoleostomius sinensis A174 TaxID=2016057 RepID=A0A9E9CCG7_9CYAN|nr:NAD(P)H-quinone oxidoreductase subunit 4 [Thermocoleostomius sinensis]WAL62885.1 NAD(P)H-quinone oxidoreductase subunit 4 [Thermocoleostomius sinensis A174]
MSTQFPWLTVLIVFPLLAALPIAFLPDKEGKTIRSYALGASLIEFAAIVYAFWQHYNFNDPSFQLVENFAWVPQIGLNWSLAVDGLSMPLVILSGLVTTLAVFASWKVTYRPRLFYSLMLILYSAQIGVFVAQDLLLFFFMWELELVPVYLLIATWGGQRRQYAATKFILYTAIGSVFILIAALAMAFYGDNVTFSLYELGLKHYSLGFEVAMYAAFLIAFGVKLPIFPFHTWLPDAHSEAPASVSMVLAGVLLKMAGYALIRFNIEMLPNAHVYFAPALAVLGAVGVIYASLTAFAQTNLKRRLAYSSIAHMGFVLIGIASFTDLGMSGAVLQMVSHGLIASSLFFLSGVAYERTHTLMMDRMGGMAKQMPTVFALFTAGAMASLALPGMSGFVGELAVFLGFATSDAYSTTFKAVIVLLAAVGVILSPIYLLSMLRVVFYGKTTEESAKFELTDANPREAFIALCLLVPIIGIGLYPKLTTQTYDVKTVAVTAEARSSLPLVAEQPFHLTLPLTAPSVFASETKELSSIVK